MKGCACHSCVFIMQGSSMLVLLWSGKILGLFQFKRGSSDKILKVHDSFKLSSPHREKMIKLPLQVCTLQFEEYEIFTGLLSFVLLLKLACMGTRSCSIGYPNILLWLKPDAVGLSRIRGPDEVQLSAGPITRLRVLPCIKTSVHFHFLNCWEGSKYEDGTDLWRNSPKKN